MSEVEVSEEYTQSAPEQNFYNPPYSAAAESLSESVYFPENEDMEEEYVDEEHEETEKGHILALMLLSAGGMLFTLSLLSLVLL